ncbi:MAG: histidine kinase [Flavobacteriales bacterium]
MKKAAIIFLHVGYWLMYLFLFVFFFLLIAGSNHLQSQEVLNELTNWGLSVSLFAVIPGALGFYAAYLFLFPRFFTTRKFGKLAIGWVAVSLGIGVLSTGIIHLALAKNPYVVVTLDILFAQTLLIGFLAAVNGVLGLVIKGFITSYTDIYVKEELDRRNLQTELDLIRTKLNPHFLFNTLNNIDVLITKDPDKASKYLIGLSALLRYVLYNVEGETAQLVEELEHIQKYVDLQKLRMSVEDAVQFEVVGEMRQRQIAPMLFLPIIENAFKYSEGVREKGVIQIHFLMDENELIFECKNRINKKRVEEYENKGGLGVDLIKRRLEILYPQKHEIQFLSDEHQFEVKLRIVW